MENPSVIANAIIIAYISCRIPAIRFPLIISFIEAPMLIPGIRSIIVPIIILSGCVLIPISDGIKESIPAIVASISVFENMLNDFLL